MLHLEDKVTKIPLVGPYYARLLEKLDIFTIKDLLLHVPSRYLDFRRKVLIKNAKVGDTVVVRGKLLFIKNQYTRGGKKIQLAKIMDASGEATIIWFNQPYLVRTIYKDDDLQIAGEVGWFGSKKAFVSPEFEKIVKEKESINTQGLVAIYPETAGISSKWLRNRIRTAYPLIEHDLEEFLPQKLLNQEGLAGFRQSFSGVHFPKNLEEAGQSKHRLAFNELLFFQLTSLYRRKNWEKNRIPHRLLIDKQKVGEFISSFPFRLTPSQIRSVGEILNDLKRPIPMNRLLEGDVGSGKTVVAAVATFVNFLNGYQSVIMAPTQILAVQHYQTLTSLFAMFKVRLTLVTAGGTIADVGKTDIFVGTHALLNHKKYFDNTTLVIIDEQHMFGVKQRSLLVKISENKNTAPHVLTMTATPIPRTVALTIYGDLDLSTLDELPPGRIPTTTWIIPPQKREGAYGWITEKIAKEQVQVFIICPLIEESQVETMKDVKAAKVEYEKIKQIFKQFKIDLLHGRQKIKEKSKIIAEFARGKTDILVTTPVVEVGIDIPNANIMIIEGAERFGLAALHQLRGRIGRGSQKSYCLLLTQNASKNVSARLTALQKEKSGFKLAEIDLKLRGPGEIFGLRQHGFPEIKIASWENAALIKKAKMVAHDILNNRRAYPKLNKFFKNIPYRSN